jgi:hypothetical protein
VLRDQAAGRPHTNRSRVIAAALALQTSTLDASSRDLLDAAAGLETLATGGEMNLDQRGRDRAAHLATVVAALDWRRQHGFSNKGGIIVFFDGQVQGWVNELRNPEHWQTGCIAVNEAGDTWVTVGGDEPNGAKMWMPEWADARLVQAG